MNMTEFVVEVGGFVEEGWGVIGDEERRNRRHL
jgi:hypothetical protein